MQCFSGCWASDASGSSAQQHTQLNYNQLKQSSSVTGAWSLSSEPEVLVHPQPPTPSPFPSTGAHAAGQHTLNSGLKHIFNNNNNNSKHAATVASSSSSSWSSPVSRDQLRQEYLLQHGSNIMAASTLQQDLKYFVIPGELPSVLLLSTAAVEPHCCCRLAVGWGCWMPESVLHMYTVLHPLGVLHKSHPLQILVAKNNEQAAT